MLFLCCNAAESHETTESLQPNPRLSEVIPMDISDSNNAKGVTQRTAPVLLEQQCVFKPVLLEQQSVFKRAATAPPVLLGSQRKDHLDTCYVMQREDTLQTVPEKPNDDTRKPASRPMARENPCSLPDAKPGPADSEQAEIGVADTSSNLEVKPVQEKHPLTSAVELGRYAAAYRELRRLESREACALTSVADVERVLRIGGKFNDAERLLRIKPEDLKCFEENVNLKLKWGMKLEGSRMIIVSVTELEGDFIKAVSLDLEGDLENMVSTDAIRQEMLSEPHAHDASWRRRLIKAGAGTKSDDILMVSSIDALDEPCQAVCVLKYTLEPPLTRCSSQTAAVDPYGTCIPAVESGHLRTPYLMMASSFVPLKRGGDQIQGVLKTEITEMEMPSAFAKALSVMPNFMLKKMRRGDLEGKAKMTADVLKNSSELINRVEAHPRSEFLRLVRSRIAA